MNMLKLDRRLEVTSVGATFLGLCLSISIVMNF